MADPGRSASEPDPRTALTDAQHVGAKKQRRASHSEPDRSWSVNAELVIVVPVLGRSQNVKPLLGSIRKTTPGACILFVADPGDEEDAGSAPAAAAALLGSGSRPILLAWSEP
jgi:hypothetical protein